MAFSRKIILLTVFFACLGSFIAYVGLQADNSGTDSITVKNNFDVPGWRYTNIPNSNAVLDSLQANITIFADYYKKKNDARVNLYIGYYDSLEQSKLSHAPQVCFTAQGWILQEDNKVMLEVDDKKREVNRLLLEKEKEQLLVYYWYQTKNDVFTDLYKMKLRLLYRKLTKGRAAEVDNAFIRVSTPVLSDLQHDKLRLEEFVNSSESAIRMLY